MVSECHIDMWNVKYILKTLLAMVVPLYLKKWMLPGQRWAWKRYEVRSLASEFNDYSIRLIGNWSHVRPFTGSITVICWPYLNQLRRATVRSPVTGELEHARYRVSKRYYASLVILKFLRSDFFGSFLYLTIVAHRFAESSLLEKSITQCNFGSSQWTKLLK